MVVVPLVTLPGGAGIVRRPDGATVVTGDVTEGHGTHLRAEDPYHPVKSWVDEERSVVGGLLPPGAVRVEVVDDLDRRVEAQLGSGAYAAMIAQVNDGEEPVVCCRDREGRPVRRPLAADYPRTAVTDTDERCPACGAVDYEEYVPHEQWRGGRPGPGGTIPNPVVACRVCGHEHRQGTFYASAPPVEAQAEDEAAREARLAEARDQRWYANTMLLRGVSFPIYAAEGWPAHIAGSASQGDALTAITIASAEGAAPPDGVGRLEVTTSIDPHQLANDLRHARETLQLWAANNQPQMSWCDRSPAALTLWLAAHQRRGRALALAAERSDPLITIDGSPQPFLTLTASTGVWVAVRIHQDLVVTIAGGDLDPGSLTVEPIADPAARLLGPPPAEL